MALQRPFGHHHRRQPRSGPGHRRRFVEAGANVLLAARGAERLHQAEAELQQHVRPGQIVVSHAGDVSRPEDCQAHCHSAAETLPGLTILVNNAGVYGPMGRIEDIDWDEWVQALQINLFGTVLMCRAILPHLREQGYGKIINLSGGGATAPLPRISAYAASKAAVVRFTETLAEEVRDDHIDVNAIAPGAQHAAARRGAGGRAGARSGKRSTSARSSSASEGGAPLEKGSGSGGLPGFGQPATASPAGCSAPSGTTGRNCPLASANLAKSDIYTLRRIVPEDRGQKWQCA